MGRRPFRARALVAGWGLLLVGLAVLAFECRRAPGASDRARTVEETGKRRSAIDGERRREEADVALPPARRVDASGAACILTGLVYGSDGKPAANVDVSADGLGPAGAIGERRRGDDSDEEDGNDDEVSTTTDENGAFELEVPPGDYALSASLDDEISDVIHPLSLGAGERLDGLELHLGAGAHLSGRIELAPGFETPPDPDDVEICILLHEHDDSCYATTSVSDDWTFAFEALPVRPLWLRAGVDEIQTTVAVTPPSHGLIVRVAPRPEISGVVRFGGVPVDSGEVLVSDGAGRLLHTIAIEEDGHFSIRTSARGKIAVWARSEERGASSALTVDADRAGDLSLELRAGAAIGGRVINKWNGAPYRGTRVCLQTAQGQELQNSSLDDEGAYRFTDITAGRYRVIACEWSAGSGDVAGLPSVEVSALAAGETRAPDLALDRERSIRARVVDRAGKPVPGAEVDLVAPDGATLSVGGAEADDEGAFVLSTHVVGPVGLRPFSSGHVGERRTVGESVGLDEEWVELTVSEQCAVSGVVRGEGGLPRGGARIACGSIQHTSTGAGRFDLACPCEVGALTVDDGHGARSVALRLHSDSSTYVEVRL